jgi:hypothetical protein
LVLLETRLALQPSGLATEMEVRYSTSNQANPQTDPVVDSAANTHITDNAEAFPTFNPPPITDQAANTLPAPAQQVTTQPTATTGVQPAADAKAVDVVIPPQMMMPAPVNTQPLTTVVLPSSRPSRVKKVWTKAKRAAKALKPTKAINVLKGLGGKISNVLRGKKSKH